MREGGAPTFSVVITAYNEAATVVEAVDSALEQTLPPFEVIVSDDGSTDETAHLLEPYRGRITYLRQEHAGVASARNAALAAARGDFYAVLDADDVYLPRRLEALAELAAERPDLDVLCTDLLLEVGGRVVGTFEATCPFETSEQRAAILDRCFCAAPAVRRTALLGVGGYDESVPTGSDWECAIRVIHAGATAGLVQEPLYRYRIRAASVTGDRVATLADRVRFLERAGGRLHLRPAEQAALERSLTRQRTALLLTEAEALLRARSPGARAHALHVAGTPGLGPRTRAAALAAAVAPRTAARILERRSRVLGYSRLSRSYPR